jgi:hypothetical protein
MKEFIETGLRFGGLSLVILCLASLWIPRVLRWNLGLLPHGGVR